VSAGAVVVEVVVVDEVGAIELVTSVVVDTTVVVGKEVSDVSDVDEDEQAAATRLTVRAMAMRRMSRSYCHGTDTGGSMIGLPAALGSGTRSYPEPFEGILTLLESAAFSN